MAILSEAFKTFYSEGIFYVGQDTGWGSANSAVRFNMTPTITAPCLDLKLGWVEGRGGQASVRSDLAFGWAGVETVNGPFLVAQARVTYSLPSREGSAQSRREEGPTPRCSPGPVAAQPEWTPAAPHHSPSCFPGEERLLRRILSPAHRTHFFSHTY